MNHNRAVQLVAVLTLIASLVAAAFVSPLVNKERLERQIVLGDEIARSMPPHMAVLTVGLSVFRGVAVDFLWYRANTLKEEGKFFEANQLSQWITALQPKFVQVWVFHAWNMAYNISVATHTPDERWEWVNKGIILLREQGLVANPKSHTLIAYLNWMFYHKIGQFSDDMNWYYKARLALEWQEILGDAPDGQTTEEAIASFAKIADAPDTLPELLDKQPQVQALLDRLAAIGFRQPDERFCREYGRVNMYVLNPGAQLLGYSLKKPVTGIAPELCKVLDDPALASAIEPLVSYARKRVIQDRYKMDTPRMLELMRTFGPLDWRHPASQACYWSSLATKIAEEERSRRDKSAPINANRDIDLLNAYRGSIHAVQELMYRGKIAFDPLVNPPRIDLLPDPRFFPAYEHAMELGLKYLESTNPGTGQGARTSFEDGHINFLATAMQFSYFYGETNQAREYYDKLANRYGARYPGRYDRPMEELIRENLVNNLDTMYHTQQFIDGMFQQAFSKGLMNGRLPVYERFISLARMVHNKWNDNRETILLRKEIGRDRQRLQPFGDLLADSLTKYLRNPGLHPVTRARIWAVAPNDLRVRIYDQVRDVAHTVAKNSGLDPALAFGEPEGLKEYRIANPIQIAKPYEAPVDGNVKIDRK